MGSSGLILTRILETHPGKQAADEAQRLLQQNDEAHAAGRKEWQSERHFYDDCFRRRP
jgi:hypothetical protein